MARQKYPGLGERIATARQEAGFNRHQAARELEIAYSTILKWEDETSVPDAVNLGAIAALGKGVNVHWLLTGQGPKGLTSPKHGVTDAPDAVEAFLVSAFAEDLSDEAKKLLRAFPFASLGHTNPTVKDVSRVADLIEVSLSTRQPSRDGSLSEK